jgi:hypothetical protein
MPRYKVAKGHELSHSERVGVVVPTFPNPLWQSATKAGCLLRATSSNCPKQTVPRLGEAGVLEAPKASPKRSRK